VAELTAIIAESKSGLLPQARELYDSRLIGIVKALSSIVRAIAIATATFLFAPSAIHNVSIHRVYLLSISIGSMASANID